MNRIFLTVILLLTMTGFSGCTKTSENGGMHFTLTTSKPYDELYLSAVVSKDVNTAPFVNKATDQVEKGIKITSLKPGSYYYSCHVSFRSSQLSGGYTFYGNVLVEKGKLMRITLEL
ncbi:hypothetical protein [Longitalea luteola]|uniref:hypothetical protein n=1 Tax=Longitalea luteola TaxID=2812563 RepID=UPI001A97BE10|nr:hypothetical protein [Longitalea luteola]